MSAIILAVARRFQLDFSVFNITPFGLVGVTLSIYLSFRNNAAYDRWWEARKLWGALVFEMRNLARATTSLIPDQTEQRALLMEALAFCHFLRGQLRKIDSTKDAHAFIDAEADKVCRLFQPGGRDGPAHGPACQCPAPGGEVDPIGFRILYERLASIAAIQAGCERIAGTPLPFAYTLLVHRTAYIVCLLLPIGLISTTGWATPLFTALIAYTFFGLDALSEELEDPFGTEANDLALDGLCRVCEISVFEALGETPPKMIPAEKFYFS